MNFENFATLVNAQIDKMASTGELYYVDVDKNLMWETYLSSFPVGSDPIYKTRTEHDCNCCKHFIRSMGNVVAISDTLDTMTIWDMVNEHPVADPEYKVVANALRELVVNKPIVNKFRHSQKKVGMKENFSETDGVIHTFNHFYHDLNDKFVNRDAGTMLSLSRDNFDVLKRACIDISVDAVETVLDLISQNSLYRGAEYQNTLQSFLQIKKQYDAILEELKDKFIWSVAEKNLVVSRINNSAIGTLLNDLSKGKSIEVAVTAFEKIVAPTNYKRPTALVTQKQIELAKKKIVELGLETALQRRYANLQDISVNDILYVNRTVAGQLKEVDMFGGITASSKGKVSSYDKVEKISIDNFISDVLPNVQSMQVLFENKHTSNLVSLIAPTDPNGGKLLKWNNDFSWSYNGNVTDSIKQRVVAAGGNINADVCIRLSWFNTDDLDLHVTEPNKNEIYYSKKQNHNKNGQLDVDMNAGSNLTRKAVENIYFSKYSNMIEGEYVVKVHQYSKREDIDPGFIVEFESGDLNKTFHYTEIVTNRKMVEVLKFKYTHKDGISIISSLKDVNRSKTEWGITTNTFHDVNVMMLSPNYWESAVDGDIKGIGNKHYFFMLQDCINGGVARGLYNEFLRTDLNDHRKVIELAGEKLKTENSEKQLSGLGFSSTINDELVVKVLGKFSRVLKIIF